MTGTLIDVIDRLASVDDSDRYDPPCIYAVGGSKAAPNALARVCAHGDDEHGLVCPQDPALNYVLSVSEAKDVIAAWTQWRNGRLPGSRDKFEAVMYYSRHDAYLPVEKGNDLHV